MEHDAWFFVGVFVFIFLVWIVTGGPLHPIAFTGPRLAEPGALGGGTYLSLPRAPYGIDNGTNVSLPGSSGGGYVSGSQASGLSGSGSTAFGAVSPYRGIISMNHYVSSAGSNPREEYLTLSVAQNATVPVDISGWTLRSDASGNTITIPKGTEVPTSGIVNAAQDIVLTAGKQALLISGQSPIGASFRENKCIGYFSSFQQFYPQLPQNCPAASNELTSNYGTDYARDAACIDFANTLSRCQVALTPPVGASSACQSFLVKYLNYNGCVDAHRSDTDFLGDTWRIYLGRTSAMWLTRHEIVHLLDSNGKTVDVFSY